MEQAPGCSCVVVRMTPEDILFGILIGLAIWLIPEWTRNRRE